MISNTESQSMLNASHREMFDRYRVSDEVLSHFCVRSVNDMEARLDYGIRGSSTMDMGGLLYEYNSAATGYRVTARVRRDHPEVDQNGNPKNKYISAWGDRKHFFHALDLLEKLRDSETAIGLVESEKAAIVGTGWADRMQQKIVFLAMGGCYGARGKVGIHTNADGERVDQVGWIGDLDYCNRRLIYLCLDANVSTNKKVKKAQDRLVRELLRRDAKVLICTLPVMDGVNGPDDYIAVAGDEAMAKVFARAVAPKQTHDFGDGKFELNDRGVWYVLNPDPEGNPRPPVWLSAPLRIVAMTRDNRSESWGRLLDWHDQDGQPHRLALPLEVLRRDGGTEAMCLLESEGLTIGASKNVKDYLLTYIRMWPTDYRARSVDKPGWAITSNGTVYVLPSEAIGSAGEPIVFQNSHSVVPAFSSSGTVEEWKQNVAALAAGNTRLVFAASQAFAGPLLDVVGEPSGGFHLRGNSSIGKTTALDLAASVWGNPQKVRRTWRSTINAMEGLAMVSNDNVLTLDELGQVDAKDAGETAYMLANGMGKSRATRNGMARPIATWNLLFLSAGETSLDHHMKTAGRKPTAGQELRMAEIDADAGRGMGILEELHGKQTPLAFIEALRERTRKYHGTVGHEYLRLLVKDRTSSTALAESLTSELRKLLTEFASAGSGPQIERVARRFALGALAGEVATKYGLTGWGEGEAKKAAATCLISWMNTFGCKGHREERRLLEQVRSFFEAHGSSRFEAMHGDDGQRIINRCGFYRVVETEPRPSGEEVPKSGGLREYLVLSEAFRNELCAGFDLGFAIQVLKKHGCLVPGKDKTTQTPTLPGMGKARVYVINASIWEDKE